MSSKADKRKLKKDGAGRAPESKGNKNSPPTEATPVSTEKSKSDRKKKKRKVDEQPSLTASKTKSQKRNSDPESHDISVGKTEDDGEADLVFDWTNKSLRAQLFPKQDDESVDSNFHGQDLTELLERRREYDGLAEKLRLSEASNQPTASVTPLTTVSDMNAFHITCERVNADGFRRLREKCEGEARSNRKLDRNLLISADAQKLIGQMLAAKNVVGFAQWKEWADAESFEQMSRIYPADKGRA
jgi:hypothetical protein